MGRGSSPYVLLVACLATALGCSAPAQRSPSIEGTWVVTKAELGGKEMPLAAFANSPLRLAGGRYEFQNDSGEYSVIPGPPPTAMDVRGQQGPNAGRTIPAIFRAQGDTLTICYDLSCKARPKDFRTEAGTQLFLVRYARTSS
jgi:uncharacterized protein (TIGR03067 family)